MWQTPLVAPPLRGRAALGKRARMIMKLLSPLLAVALVACASTSTPSSGAPAPTDAAATIERTERAFAADAAQRGWVASFKSYAAADAIVLWTGEPTDAQTNIATLPSEVDTSLKWRPLWTGSSRSGDLGFSTGPVVNGARNSQYFSIWRKNADDSWQWIYDGGFASDGPSPTASDAPAVHAPLAAQGAGGAAIHEVKAAEEKLADAAANDYRASLSAMLAADGRLLGSRAQPAAGDAARAAEFATRPAKVSLGTLGAVQSQAGDMVYTYGATLWMEGDVVKRGHYVRVWRLDAAGWRIVADVFLPKR